MTEPDVLVKIVGLDRSIEYYGYYDPSEKKSLSLHVVAIHQVETAEEANYQENNPKTDLQIFFTEDMIGDFIRIQHLKPETSANRETICHCSYCLNKTK